MAKRPERNLHPGELGYQQHEDRKIPVAETPFHERPATPEEVAWQIAGSHGMRRRKLTDAEISEALEIVAELERRDAAALNIYKAVRPEGEALHASLAKEIVAFGSNRACKTTTCIAQDAMIFTGTHPFLSGKPWGTPKTNGRAAIVGKTLGHVGRVLYPKLFLPGAIKMLRDGETGRWRAWLGRNDPEQDREPEIVDAPPFIPPELVMPKGTAWLKSRENIPKRIVLKNGWELYFFSSEGDPPRGDDYDWVHLDEEMLTTSWYPEMAMRVVTRKGRIMWSATGQDGGEEMFEVFERAESQVNDENPRTQAYLFLIENNPYVSRVELENAKERLRNRPDEYAARIEGRWLTGGFRIYPDFNLETHGFDLSKLENKRVPAGWARWIAVDPGRQTCAALFLAMPPTGHFVLAYAELYLRLCTAQRFGDEMARVMRDQFFEAVLIDSKAAMVHEMSSGITRERYYWEAMNRHKLWDHVRNKTFVYGDTDVDGGIEAVHNWLHIEGTSGLPYFRVATLPTPRGVQECLLPNLASEFSRYSYQRDGKSKKPTDKPNTRSDSHLMDDARYLAQYRPRFRAPEKPAPARSYGGRRYEEIMRGERQRQPISFAPSSRSLHSEIIVSSR